MNSCTLTLLSRLTMLTVVVPITTTEVAVNLIMLLQISMVAVQMSYASFAPKRGIVLKLAANFTNNKRQPSQPAAYAAQAKIPPPKWLFDSGASHHITNDLQNLSLHNDYNGNDHLHVANGMSLPITHVGSTTLNSSKPNRNLVLNNVLYAPGVSQNLVSVSQLCNTNNVSIEFFPSFFKVKDLTTGACLLQGPNDSNVYKLPTSTSPRVYSAVSTPSLC